jgi:CBS domain-containing protein/sporulation protein YlmC with PRC-barrel domain
MVIEGLVPVAGLVGVHVATAEGAEVGRVADVVVRWGAGSYPAVTGLVVRVGLRRAFVHVEQVAKLAAEGVRLESARVDLRDFVRRPGEVLLARDVIDHQLVDVDGARVVRASDLYLAPVAGLYRLVGVDVGMGAFLRRVGPAVMRRRVSPERVIDWADVAPFSAPGAPVRLRTSHERLRELHPAELADLLEDLGRAERHELLNALAPETAADVLEEMEPDELTELLRDAPPGEAADLLVRMEPDEAVDALRELADDDREAILAAMPVETATQLTGLLAYPEREAGGFMTTHLVLAHMAETVAGARELLRERREHGGDIDALVVVDDEGGLVDDVPLFDLLVHDGATPLHDLVRPPWPATVSADADLDEVVDKLTANRSSSLLVVDDEQRPLGRILADDVLDVLAAARGRRWPWQQR